MVEVQLQILKQEEKLIALRTNRQLQKQLAF